MPTIERNDQPEPPSGSDQGASAPGGEAVKAPPAEREQPEKPAAASVSAAAALPNSQPRPGGGTGLMGFWVKVAATAFVIFAGIIGIYAFFSDDEATPGPQATQAAADDQSDDASATDSEVTNSEVTNRETTPGVVLLTPTQQSNVIDLGSLPEYRNEPGTIAGTAAVNEPAVETANTGGVSTPVTPATDQTDASRWDTAPSITPSGHFSEQAAEYRPELYRPLKPEQTPPRTTQPAGVHGTPRAFSLPVPSNHPQPGAYTYPTPYGHPLPGAYAYPPAPYDRGYGGYYPY